MVLFDLKVLNDEGLRNLFTLVQIFLTMTGIVLVFVQLRRVRETIRSNTNSKLLDQSHNLIQFLNQVEGGYDYFYHGKALEADIKEETKVKILYAAESYANFMEHLMLQRKNMQTEQWKVWDRFICGSFKASVVIKQFINEHQTWYSEELKQKMRDCANKA